MAPLSESKQGVNFNPAAAPYRGADGKVVGVVGVIGPTRLNYARVVPMVDFTAQVLTRLIA